MAGVNILITLVSVILAYFLFLRHTLAKVFPATYGEAHKQEEALLQRLKGFRTILLARIQVTAGVATTMGVELYQFAKPAVDELNSTGWDWKTLIPQDKALWAIPLILLASGLLHEWLRRNTDGPVQE